MDTLLFATVAIDQWIGATLFAFGVSVALKLIRNKKEISSLDGHILSPNPSNLIPLCEKLNFVPGNDLPLKYQLFDEVLDYYVSGSTATLWQEETTVVDKRDLDTPGKHIIVHSHHFGFLNISIRIKMIQIDGFLDTQI